MTTRYELAVYSRTGEKTVLPGFTARRTRSSLIKFAIAHGDMLLTMMTDVEADMKWSYHHSTGVTFGGGAVRVDFTGRTEAQAR